MDPDIDKWINTHCLDADVFVLVSNAESTLMQSVSLASYLCMYRHTHEEYVCSHMHTFNIPVCACTYIVGEEVLPPCK